MDDSAFWFLILFVLVLFVFLFLFLGLGWRFIHSDLSRCGMDVDGDLFVGYE